MQTYTIIYNDRGREVGRTPITQPHEVHRGRCLICNPFDRRRRRGDGRNDGNDDGGAAAVGNAVGG
eukprot:CAMPEP_0178599970 /NCGR_PEP_ID=MMETSP0697-20121206/33605_1 /TAXON_ID=265572 /ORGANISM="Extubocellulus spinifer, Strain CCMP396" /LENGTH=65 /DNA_ID=CAMNT_0020237931 /DNA_START=18 /DNA_END=212 /DNA_ORIENTATION=-